MGFFFSKNNLEKNSLALFKMRKLLYVASNPEESSKKNGIILIGKPESLDGETDFLTR